MKREINALLLKSNRIMGTRLVEAGLANLEHLDAANAVFIERVREKNLKRASLLRILIYEQQTLKEGELMDHQFEYHGLGAVQLDGYRVDEGLLGLFDAAEMRATWTVPVDKVEGHWFLATAYYLSDIVRQHWEDALDGEITWYVTSLGQIESFLEEREAAGAAETTQVGG